LVLNWR